MSAFDEYRAKRVAGYISSAFHNGGKVLDLGCGRMVVAQHVRQNTGAIIVGVDVIDVNQTSLPLCIAEGKQLPFDNGRFDAVYAALVLHHTYDPLAVVQEGLRVTRKRLIILEDVHESRVELALLKILDWIGNRSISADMRFPYNFKSEKQWLQIFNDLKLTVNGIHPIRPVPWRPTRHRMFILEKMHQPELELPSTLAGS